MAISVALDDQGEMVPARGKTYRAVKPCSVGFLELGLDKRFGRVQSHIVTVREQGVENATLLGSLRQRLLSLGRGRVDEVQMHCIERGDLGNDGLKVGEKNRTTGRRDGRGTGNGEHLPESVSSNARER